MDSINLEQKMMKSSLHAEEDDFVPELQRSIHPRERPDWEETLSAMFSSRYMDSIMRIMKSIRSLGSATNKEGDEMMMPFDFAPCPEA
ncbi:UNVERIFIED_CONTAM: hypothetical protein K2H54_021160 [Gekko kuhli]